MPPRRPTAVSPRRHGTGACAAALACAALLALAPGAWATGVPRALTVGVDRASGSIVVEDPTYGPRLRATVPPALRVGGTWHGATRLVDAGRDHATYETSDPAGRRIELAIAPDAETPGLTATPSDPTGVEAMRIGFAASDGERFLGFGERSDAVARASGDVSNFVQEGPYPPQDYDAVAASIPPWALRRTPDATYFPMPWMVSTRGYGVLVEDTEESTLRLRTEHPDAWAADVEAPQLRLRFVNGPSPGAIVGRLTTLTGRQPAAAAPWILGPWFQTGHSNEVTEEMSYVRALRRADAPVSAAETHMRYLPCGADRGREEAERQRVRDLHGAGLAALTYTREAICDQYQPEFDQAAAGGLVTRTTSGGPYRYRAFVGVGVTDVEQLDFSAPAATDFYIRLMQRPIGNGYDGWMEDYGEYTPPDSVSANGMAGAEMHNLYPVLYHRAGNEVARTAPRPVTRFVRSGWTGVHPYAPIVWGGDPTTGFGFDGLRSSVREALSMGLSGISTWGSDIGGFFTLSDERLTPELLARWIQFGAVSGVMRTKAEGIGVAKAQRPQIWERPTLPRWRRYAKLRTQLYPYLVAAQRHYARTGVPLMRHMVFADAALAERDDQFFFGPDLLAAPVLDAGARRRRVALPAGRWVDLWRSLRYDERTGGLRLGRRARILRGRRTVTVPAPLDELPLLARAGTILPLLPADVDTLAGYGHGVIHLRDRADRMELLAFPSGSSSAAFGEGERLRSTLRGRTWTLRIDGARTRTYRIQAALPWRTCDVTLNGRPAALTRVRMHRGTLRVRGCAP